MTKCNQTGFPFEAHFSRQVVARFDGARMSTEGGALLLREADRKIGLLKRVARCFTDARDPERIEHTRGEMLAQRIYGLALGYEDLNDHEGLRRGAWWPRPSIWAREKIAAQVRVTARRIWVRYARCYPWETLFVAAWQALRC